MVETWRLIYWTTIFGHQNGSGGYQIYTGVPGVTGTTPPGGGGGYKGPTGAYGHGGGGGRGGGGGGFPPPPGVRLPSFSVWD